MKHYAWAVGVASTALILAVNIKSSEQTAPRRQPRSVSTAPAPGVPPARPAPPRRAVSRPPTAAAFTAATKSLFEDTCSECHNSSDPAGGLDVALYGSVETLQADRDRWELILSKLKNREMPPDDASVPPSEEQVTSLVTLLEKEFLRADAAMKPDPGRVDGAALEPRGIHQHDPRSARRRVPRRPEFPDRRFRRGLRQPRRRAHRLARVDGEVSLCRGPDCRAGDRDRKPAEAGRGRIQPALQEPAARRSEQRRGDTPLRFRRRLRAQDRSAGTAGEGCPAGDARPLGGRKAGAQHAGRDQAVRSRLLQPAVRGADPHRDSRRRSHAAPRVHRRSLRQDAGEGGHLQGHGQQVDRRGHRHRSVRLRG